MQLERADLVPGDSVPAARLADWVELTKPRITSMVAVTAAAGYLLGGRSVGAEHTGWLGFMAAVLGTGLLSAGAGTFNHLLERSHDARMRRTAQRPLPTGRVDPESALLFGLTLVTAGLLVLLTWARPLTALLGALTVAGYVFVYTPLKRQTSFATVVGAVPGAIPPMMGWSAATGGLEPGAWALFGLLFFWQMPHFLAIAWMYREDYARGGFPLLTVGDRDGRATAFQMLLWGAALIPVSLLPSALRLTGLTYFAGTLVLGLLYLTACFRFAHLPGQPTARRVLLTSVFYLPGIFLLTLIDRLLAG